MGRVSKHARSLRSRVLTSIVGVATLAVALFAAPLGYAVAVGYRNEAVTNLQRESTRVAATVSDSFGTDGSTVTLPADLPASLTVGVYRTDGTLIAFHGPQRSSVASTVADGHLHNGVENGAMAVAAPVPSDGGVTLAVRVAEPYRTLWQRIIRAWTLMALLGAVVVVLAAVLARRQARQIAHPLEQLTTNARALGDGDFTIRAAGTRIAEADAAGVALEATARRLGDLLGRERAFSTHVSHQLRTPLTALLLGLESALSRPDTDPHDLRAAAERALRRAEHLRTTVDDLLGLARDTHPAGDPLDIADLQADLRERWHAAFAAKGRRLTLLPAAPDLPAVTASSAAVRQILDVLLGNALVHGAGTVNMAVEDVGTGIALEVSDEGAGLGGDPESAFARRTSGGAGHGIGLALARTLAEAEDGRLVVRRATPHPIFSLLLPLPFRTGNRAHAAS
jgi:signal transduction histidine kinase